MPTVYDSTYPITPGSLEMGKITGMLKGYGFTIVSLFDDNRLMFSFQEEFTRWGICYGTHSKSDSWLIPRTHLRKAVQFWSSTPGIALLTENYGEQHGTILIGVYGADVEELPTCFMTEAHVQVRKEQPPVYPIGVWAIRQDLELSDTCYNRFIPRETQKKYYPR